MAKRRRTIEEFGKDDAQARAVSRKRKKYSRKEKPKTKPATIHGKSEEDLQEEDHNPLAGTLCGKSEEVLQEGSCRKLSIHDLPDEMLCHMFSFLELRDILSAKRVCERWKSVAEDDSLWRTLTLSCGVTIRNREEIGMVKECPKLRWVRAEGWSNCVIAADILKAVADHCPKLQGIKVELNEYNVSVIETVARQCPMIELLHLRKFFQSAYRISNILGNCRNLKKFCLPYIVNLPGVCDAIAEGCPLLQSLILLGSDYSRVELARLLQRIGHQLKELSYKCCSTDSEQHCVFPDISRCCSGLEVLRIRCHVGPLDTLKDFLQSEAGRNLTKLELSYFKDVDINESFCTALFKNCTNLTSLTLKEVGLKDNYMVCVGELKNLKELEIYGKGNTLTHKAVMNIVWCKALEYLSLQSKKMFTNESFVTICEELPNLQKLSMHRAAVTSESLLLVTQHLKKLRHLRLGLQYLDPEAFKALKAHMPHLDLL